MPLLLSETPEQNADNSKAPLKLEDNKSSEVSKKFPKTIFKIEKVEQSIQNGEVQKCQKRPKEHKECNGTLNSCKSLKKKGKLEGFKQKKYNDEELEKSSTIEKTSSMSTKAQFSLFSCTHSCCSPAIDIKLTPASTIRQNRDFSQFRTEKLEMTDNIRGVTKPIFRFERAKKN